MKGPILTPVRVSGTQFQGSLIEAANRYAMAQAQTVDSYATLNDLYPGEQLLYAAAEPEVAGRPILDLGVGAGRTVAALTSISSRYVAIDYTQAMIDATRRRFPGLDVRLGDARSLPELAGASFALVVFSCSGIDMAAPDDRQRILHEVHRLLLPNGLFVFSTHNWDYWRTTSRHPLAPSKPSGHPHPLQALRSLAGGMLRAPARVYNRHVLRAMEQRSDHWGIINTPYHDWSTMLHCVTLHEQRAQLQRAGFEPNARAATHEGEWITGDSSNTWMLHLLARKRRAP